MPILLFGAHLIWSKIKCTFLEDRGTYTKKLSSDFLNENGMDIAIWEYLFFCLIWTLPELAYWA